jgi:hypothetical protein
MRSLYANKNVAYNTCIIIILIKKRLVYKFSYTLVGRNYAVGKSEKRIIIVNLADFIYEQKNLIILYIKKVPKGL